MKLGKLLISIVVVSLLVSMAIPMAAAPKPDKCTPWPECRDSGGEEPPADPVIAFRNYGTLAVMNADGTNRVQVFSGEGIGGAGISWSPGGDAIAFRYSGTVWRVDVTVVDGVPVGSNPMELFPEPYYAIRRPAWSPSPTGPLGDVIAFGDKDPVDKTIPTIETVSASGGTVQRLYTGVSGDHIFDLAWSPDATQIAFITVADGINKLFVLDIASDGATSATLRYGPVDFWLNDVDWSRTGNILTLWSRGPVVERSIYLLDLDDSSPTLEYLMDGHSPSWSPDDSQLVFGKPVYKRNGLRRGTDIWVYDFATEQDTKLGGGDYCDWSRAPSA